MGWTVQQAELIWLVVHPVSVSALHQASSRGQLSLVVVWLQQAPRATPVSLLLTWSLQRESRLQSEGGSMIMVDSLFGLHPNDQLTGLAYLWPAGQVACNLLSPVLDARQ